MKNFFYVVVLILSSISLTAQIRTLNGNRNEINGLNNNQLDSLNNDEISVKIKGKTKYTDYKIISHNNDSTHIDTTLTIAKTYKHNFLRKDHFELLPFHNQGQTFNNLAYTFRKVNLYPNMGFHSKQFNYLNFDEIKYYHVPTPTSEIMYKTGQEQGQVLDALFTLNFSKRLNISFSYKGLRSLGHYRESLSSSGNFRTTLSYQTLKKQYAFRFHYASQNITNQESGGLTQKSLESFFSEDPNFNQRGRLDTNLEGVTTTFEGDRFYVDHNIKLFSKIDNTNTKKLSNLKLGHEFRYEKKEYTFDQSQNNEAFFGRSSARTPKKEPTLYSVLDNSAYLEFNSKYVLGKFKVKANYTKVSYGYDTIMNNTPLISKMKLKGKALSGGASWKGKIGNFNVNTDVTLIPGSGHLAGNYIKAEAFYKKDSLFTIKGTLSQISKAPKFTTQLFQSAYEAYNWNNDFNNVDTRNLGVTFLSKWGDVTFDFTNIDDYVYFNKTNKPQQYNNQITYFKLRANKEFKLFWKFSLNNTLLYQNVTSGSKVFRVPNFSTRNSFYFTDKWFKGNPLLVNVGFTFRYFTKYKMNAFNPIISEFVLQDQTEIGFPTLDVFFSARVRRTRIFFKIDNVTSNWTAKNYFSAPNYPYRDFSIRFGLVWNWFI